PAVGAAGDVRHRPDEAVAPEEAEREPLVLAGGSHGDREGVAVEPDLERLLDDDPIDAAGGGRAHPLDRPLGDAAHASGVAPRPAPRKHPLAPDAEPGEHAYMS